MSKNRIFSAIYFILITIAFGASVAHAAIPSFHVIHSNSLCPRELKVAEIRKAKAQQTLNTLYHKNLDLSDVPTMAVALSGGGCRAAIATLGMLKGLETIGLLDAITYVAGVSGSTWTMGSWTYHGMTLDQTIQFVRNKLKGHFNFKKIDRPHVVTSMYSKQQAGRKTSLNDTLGSLMGDVFLGTDTFSGKDAYLHHLAPRINTGQFPIPIFTAVIGQTSPNYEWMEFTPYQVGSTYLNAWINSDTFGKKFENGVSTDIYPPESFGYQLGIFGSAYAGSLKDAVDRLSKFLEGSYNIGFSPLLLSHFDWAKDLRLSPPSVLNFSYQSPLSPLSSLTHLSLIDAGAHMNLPFPPLIRRNVSLYFVCDASRHAASIAASPMYKVEEYMQQQGLAFPALDYKKLVKRKVSVWADKQNSNAPVVIYMPNFEKFSTTKTKYSDQEFDRIFNAFKDPIIKQKDLIKLAIDIAIDNEKRKKKSN